MEIWVAEVDDRLEYRPSSLISLHCTQETAREACQEEENKREDSITLNWTENGSLLYWTKNGRLLSVASNDEETRYYSVSLQVVLP